ncbi:hypothetical protein TcWFU_002683 [Taenia crassiceps]|uniref:UspA domain-containing protein n=1 Tax=Taenia crassiceps TaxID=6207 RepID=A0ABR4QR98_9CEST
MALDNLIDIPVENTLTNIGDGDAVLAKFRKLAEQADVNYTVETLADASVADAILRLTSDREANLVVVGSRGASGVRRASLGSVSRHLVAHSSVPVLVVPPEASNHLSTSA